MRYLRNYQKVWLLLGISFGGIIGFFSLRYARHQKRELAAKQAIWPAEAYLREGKYDLALEGGGGDMGLLDMLAQFGDTKAGNLARLYAAVAYLGKEPKDEEAAIKYLKDFKGEQSFMQARVWSLLGDIYLDRGAYEEAKVYYDKAAHHMPNGFTTPDYLCKAAFVCEQMRDYQGAIGYYERIYTRFPKSERAQEAMKHESRVRQLAALAHKR